MNLITPIIQGLALILVAPLVVGSLRVFRARGQGRKGPPFFQPYYDLYKLFSKTSFRSQQAIWIFRATPYISFSCFGIIAFSLPVFAPPLLSPNLITLIYIIGLVAFFNALAGMSVSTPFGGLGSSRLMFLHVLVEPTLFLIVLALVLRWHTTDLVTLIERHQQLFDKTSFPLSVLMVFYDPANIILLAAMFIVTLIEAHRIPVDNLETNLELTMISRAVWLEYSGPHLALAEWAEALKLLIFLTLLVTIFCPDWPPPAGADSTLALSVMTLLLKIGVYLVKMVIFILVLAVWELCHLRIRLGTVLEPNMAAIYLAMLALAFIIANIYLAKG
jgi:formate hydrogenlyase subunit 4